MKYRIKEIITLLLFMIVVHNVDAQKDFDKLIEQTLNEKKIYEAERDSVIELLNNKLRFFNYKRNELRMEAFTDQDINLWRDSIKQATGILDIYSREYIYDLKNKYENFPERDLKEEAEKRELEKNILELKETFNHRAEEFKKKKNRIENNEDVPIFTKKYVAIGGTFKSDGTERISNSFKYRLLPKGDYIILRKKIEDTYGDKYLKVRLKSMESNKRYTIVSPNFSVAFTTIYKLNTKFRLKFVDYQKKIKELEEQLDYSKSVENQQVEEKKKEIIKLNIKIDSLKNMPNPYKNEYEKFIALAETLSKGGEVLKLASRRKDSHHKDLLTQSNEARRAEYLRQEELRKNNEISKKNNLIAKYGKEVGTKIYNGEYWVGMKEEYLKIGDYSVTLVHRDGNMKVYRYYYYFDDKYVVFKNGRSTSLLNYFTINN